MIFPNFVLFLILKPILFSSKSSNYETIVSMETELDERTNSFLTIPDTDWINTVRVDPKTTNNIIQNSENYQEAESGSLTQDFSLNDFCERNKTIVVFSIASLNLLVVASLLIVKLL